MSHSDWTWEASVGADGGAPLLITGLGAFASWRGEVGTLDRPDGGMVSAYGSCVPQGLPIELANAPVGWGHPTAEVATWEDAGRLMEVVAAAVKREHPSLRASGPGKPMLDTAIDQMIETLRQTKGEAAAEAFQARFPRATRSREEVVFDGGEKQRLVLERLPANDFRRSLGQLDPEVEAGLVKFSGQTGLFWRLAGAGVVRIGRHGGSGAWLFAKVLFVDGESDEEQDACAAAALRRAGELAGGEPALCRLPLRDDRAVAVWCPISGTELERVEADGGFASGSGQVIAIPRGDYDVTTGETEEDEFGVRWCLLRRGA